MIQIKDLFFTYQTNTTLENISINFEEQCVHGIVGLNGSGKTTFFNLLSGFITPDKGSITFHNESIKKQSIAYIDSETFFYPKLTAKEFLSVFPQSNVNYKEDELVSIFNLPINEFVENYSTGMKKKLLIISQLKQDKQIYIFDEPFNGLDIESNKSLQIIIEILSAKKKTIFISSHIIEPLYSICNKIHHLTNKNFAKTYLPTEYNQIENDVFGNFTEALKQMLQKSV